VGGGSDSENGRCARLTDLRRQTHTPVCGSETLAGTVPFRDLLAADAIDFVMLDLAWCGGLTEGRKIARWPRHTANRSRRMIAPDR